MHRRNVQRLGLGLGIGLRKTTPPVVSSVVVKGAKFGGDDQILLSAAFPILDATTTWTIEAWVRHTGGSGFYFIYFQDGPTDTHMQLALETSTDKHARMFLIASAGNVNVQGATVNPANTLMHIAFVRDGNDLTIYRNGVSEQTGTYPGGTVGFNAAVIGRSSSGTEGFQGDLFEMRGWRSARTQPNVVSDANTRGLVGGEEFVVLCDWDGTQVIPDETGNGHTGANGSTDSSNANPVSVDGALLTI